jgi:hypothetical protein
VMKSLKTAQDFNRLSFCSLVSALSFLLSRFCSLVFAPSSLLPHLVRAGSSATVHDRSFGSDPRIIRVDPR